MDRSIKITVAMISFNAEKYIIECIESVLNQSFSKFELMVIDAGSKDNTEQIVRGYERIDDRVHFISTEIDSVGHQYNLGIDSAKGKYIAFIESDDLWHKDMLKNLYHAAEKYDADYVKSDFEMFTGEGDKRVSINYQVLGRSRVKRELYDKPFAPRDYPDIAFRDVNIWNGIYKVSFLRNNAIRLNESPKAAYQDVGYALQTLFLAEKAVYIHGSSYCYRRDNMKSSVYNPMGLKKFQYELEFVYKMVKDRQLNGKTEVVIFRRVSELYEGFYRKVPKELEHSDEIHEIHGRMRGILREWHDSIDETLREDFVLDNIPSLYMLLKDKEGLGDYLKAQGDYEIDILQTTYNKIKLHDKVVIFGASESGESCHAFLRNNGYKGEIFFTDNNKGLWSTKRMGADIIEPEEAAHISGDAIYLLCSYLKWEEMRDQLMGFGVVRQSISRFPYLSAHRSLEVSVK